MRFFFIYFYVLSLMRTTDPKPKLIIISIFLEIPNLLMYNY